MSQAVSTSGSLLSVIVNPGSGSLAECGVTYIESLDLANPAVLRELDSGCYVLYGKFKAYSGDDTIIVFESKLNANIVKSTDCSSIMIFNPVNSKVECLTIYDDRYERTDLALQDAVAHIGQLKDDLASQPFSATVHYGAFLTQNGTLMESETGAYTDKVHVKKGDSFTVVSDAYTNAVAYIVFNGDNVVDFNKAQSPSGAQTYNVTIGENATHIAFSCASLSNFSVKKTSDDSVVGLMAETINSVNRISSTVNDIETKIDYLGVLDEDINATINKGGLVRYFNIIHGKNLYIRNNGEYANASVDSRATELIYVEDNTMIFLEIDVSIYCYDKDKSYLGKVSLVDGIYTFVNGTKYIASWFSKELFDALNGKVAYILSNNFVSLPLNQRKYVFHELENTNPAFEVSKNILSSEMARSIPMSDSSRNFSGAYGENHGVFVNMSGANASIGLREVPNGTTWCYEEFVATNGKVIGKEEGKPVTGNLLYGTLTMHDGTTVNMNGKFPCVIMRDGACLYKCDMQLTDETWEVGHYINYLAYEDGTQIDVANDTLYLKKFFLFNTDIDDAETIFSIMQNGNTHTALSEYAKYVVEFTDQQVETLSEVVKQKIGSASEEEIVGLQKSNPLWGRYLCTTGDSLTAGSGIADIYPKWQNRPTHGYIVAERNKMTFLNDGIGGSTMGNVVANGSDKNGFSKTRYLNIPENVDFLTIMFGWNDMAYGPVHHKDIWCKEQYNKLYTDCTTEQKAACDAVRDWGMYYIGEVDSTDDTTWCGAWNKVLDYYMRNRPNTKVGVFLPFLGKNTLANKARETLKVICVNYAVPTLDAADPDSWSSTGFSTGISTSVATYLKSVRTVDGLHDNEYSYRLKANQFESWLKRL